MKIKTAIFILLTPLAFSCVTVKQSKVPKETIFNSKNTNGLVIGTITFVHPKKQSPYTNYKFHLTYENANIEEVKNNSTYFSVNVNLFNGRFNGELNENKTFPFVLEQKPGKYNFDGFWFFWNGGMITKEITNPTPFSLPFTVEQSKITYIGNIIINVNNNYNPYIEINDQLSNTINYFKIKYPNIDWNLVVNKTIKEGDNGYGFVKFSD